jgi:TPR repeat protein
MFRFRTIGSILLIIVIVLITLNSLNNSYVVKLIAGKTPYNSQSTELRINVWLLKARASLGGTDAKVNYAILMFQHSKNPAVVKSAFQDLQSLVKQGNLHAIYLLGITNLTGAPGIKVNEKQGFAYLKEAASKGFKPAKQFLTKFKKLSESKGQGS